MDRQAKDTLLRDKVMPSFMASVAAAFETMAFLPVTCGDIGSDKAKLPEGRISGTIGLTGSVDALGGDICGNVALIFPDGVAEKVFRGMMMMGDDDEVELDEVKDAVGELANMVAGGAKTKLQDDGMNYMISLPSVIVGDAHYIAAPANAFVYVVPVSSDKGAFHLEVTFS